MTYKQKALAEMSEQCPVCVFRAMACAEDEKTYIDRFVAKRHTWPRFIHECSPRANKE